MEQITEKLFDVLKKVVNPKYKLYVTTDVTVNDVLQYTNEKNGLFLAYPSMLENDMFCTVSYSAIFIDREKGRINCFNTRGRTMNCTTFLTLSEMKEGGLPVVYSQYRLRCENNDLQFIAYIADLFTNKIVMENKGKPYVLYNNLLTYKYCGG